MKHGRGRTLIQRKEFVIASLLLNFPEQSIFHIIMFYIKGILEANVNKNIINLCN